MIPESLWRTTLSTARQALLRAGVEPSALAGLGITNQRETTLVWSRTTGRPIHNAIVWQDRRTAPLCAELKERGCETLVSTRAGLLLDPYFSATKIAWILDNVPDARAEAERGELAFGTVDSFLVWRLTNGKVHVTDATNASRTLLFNIHSGAWDDDLLALFGSPSVDAARGQGLRRRIRRGGGRTSGRRDPHPRHRRGSAGGPDWPGVLSSRAW